MVDQAGMGRFQASGLSILLGTNSDEGSIAATSLLPRIFPPVLGEPINLGVMSAEVFGDALASLMHESTSYELLEVAKFMYTNWTESEANNQQVWSLSQFYSVDFSQSRIGVNMCVFRFASVLCLTVYLTNLMVFLFLSCSGVAGTNRREKCSTEDGDH